MAHLSANVAKRLNDVTAERDALKKQLEEKNASSKSEELLSRTLRELELERSEKQRLKSERDDIQARLLEAEVALKKMEREVEQCSRQKSQADQLRERFDAERAEHNEKEKNLEEETHQWRERYECLITQNETEKESTLKKVKSLEYQLDAASRREVELSAEISELQGTLSEQNARLEEYYDHMKEQDNNIESLKFDKKCMQGLEGSLAMAENEKRQLKMQVETCLEQLRAYEGRCAALMKDLDVKNGEVREAQRQQAECHRRLQLAEGELAVVRKKLEEVEGEKAHMDQQLLMYVKDFEEERKAREKEVQVIEGLQKKLAEAKSENNALRQELNRQADYIQRLDPGMTMDTLTLEEEPPSGGLRSIYPGQEPRHVGPAPRNFGQPILGMGPRDDGMGTRGMGPRDDGMGTRGPRDDGMGTRGMGPRDDGMGTRGMGPRDDGMGTRGMGPRDDGMGTRGNWTQWEPSMPRAQEYKNVYTSVDPALSPQFLRDQGGRGGAMDPPYARTSSNGKKDPYTSEEPRGRDGDQWQDEPRADSSAVLPSCPICGRNGFLTAAELQEHSSKCTNFSP